MNRSFHYTDYVLIASVILVLRGREITSLIFTTAAAVIHDAFVMPASGYALFSGLAAYLLALSLSVSLYKENYPTQVVIIAICSLAKNLVLVLLAFLFYNKAKQVLFPAFIISVRVAAATLAGAVVLKLMETDYGKALKWLKLKTTSSRG